MYDDCGQLINAECDDCGERVGHEDNTVTLDDGAAVCKRCARCSLCEHEHGEGLVIERGFGERGTVCRACVLRLEGE